MRISFEIVTFFLCSLSIFSCQKELEPLDVSQSVATDFTSHVNDKNSVAGVYQPLRVGWWWKYKDSG